MGPSFGFVEYPEYMFCKLPLRSLRYTFCKIPLRSLIKKLGMCHLGRVARQSNVPKLFSVQSRLSALQDSLAQQWDEV